MPTKAKPISKKVLYAKKALKRIVLSLAQKKELYLCLGEDKEVDVIIAGKSKLAGELERILSQHSIAVVSIDKQPIRPANQRAAIENIQHYSKLLYEALDDLDVYSKSTLSYQKHYRIINDLDELKRYCDSVLISLEGKSSKGNVTNKAVYVTADYLSRLFDKWNVHERPTDDTRTTFDMYKKAIRENKKIFVKKALDFAEIEYSTSIDRFITF